MKNTLEKYSIHNTCTCSCHIKGRNILHISPCCSKTYVKYLIQDEHRNIVFDPETTIVVSLSEDNLR